MNLYNPRRMKMYNFPANKERYQNVVARFSQGYDQMFFQ